MTMSGNNEWNDERAELLSLLIKEQKSRVQGAGKSRQRSGNDERSPLLAKKQGQPANDLDKPSGKVKVALDSSLLKLADGEDTEPPLFLVGMFHFRALAPRLAGSRSVYGLAGKNLDLDLNYMHRVRKMARDYIQDVRRVQPNGPYALGGFCFGGLVAYEMACQLRDAGEDVSHLILIDSVSPNAAVDSAKYLDGFDFVNAEKAAESDQNRDFSPDMVKGYFNRFIDWVRRRWRYERSARIEKMQRLLGRLFIWFGQPVPLRLRGAVTMKADAAAAALYDPPHYCGSVLLVRCTEDGSGNEERNRYWTEHPAYGWDDLVAGSIDVRDLNTHHGEVLRPPYVYSLAEGILEYLDVSHSRRQNACKS
jgi:thioesterase domain-containing protein